ncbi:MAG: DMT family transporter [Patescibacteria group bacterium]
MRIFEKWMIWAVSEGFARAFNGMMAKIIGGLSRTISQFYVVILIIGIVQGSIGFFVSRVRGVNLFPNRASIFGCISFGIMAVILTSVTFTVFMLGGSISMFVFIISLSIIPGAIIDRIFFKYKLNKLQWLGVGVGLFGAYAMLNFPSISTLRNLPLWVGIAFVNAIGVSVNQGITKKIKDVDPFVKNFWVGITTFLISLTVLFVLKEYGKDMPVKFFIIPWILGAGTFFLVLANLMSYKRGANMAVKNLIDRSSYLIFGTLGGIFFFGEKLFIGQGIGIVCYFIALYLMTNNKEII